MFFLRRLIGRMLFVTILGYMIRKLMASENLRAQKVGRTANKALGGVFGVNANGRVKPRRGVVRSAGSAAVGGLASYFFDPDQGADRRARAKGFAKQRLARNGQHAMLPEHATAPAVAQSRSNIV